MVQASLSESSIDRCMLVLWLKERQIVEKDDSLSEKLTFHLLPKNLLWKAYIRLAPNTVCMHEWQQCIVSLLLFYIVQNHDEARH